MARIGRKPLDGIAGVFFYTPAGMGFDPVYNKLNLEPSHQHLFFADGTNIGFSPDGLFYYGSDDPALKLFVYWAWEGLANDDVVRVAVSQVVAGHYHLATNNCQGFVARVVERYQTLDRAGVKRGLKSLRHLKVKLNKPGTSTSSRP